MTIVHHNPANLAARSLLPPKRDENITARLRKSRTFESYRSKTDRFYIHLYSP